MVLLQLLFHESLTSRWALGRCAAEAVGKLAQTLAAGKLAAPGPFEIQFKAQTFIFRGYAGRCRIHTDLPHLFPGFLSRWRLAGEIPSEPWGSCLQPEPQLGLLSQGQAEPWKDLCLWQGVAYLDSRRD